MVPASQPSYLRFNHAYVFEWYDAEDGFPAYYPDGGQVLVQTLSGTTWTTRSCHVGQRTGQVARRDHDQGLRW